MKIVPVRDRICHSCGSRACPALDAGNPGFLNTGSLFSQGQAWIPICTGMTDRSRKQDVNNNSWKGRMDVRFATSYQWI
jgi:hypothetical protein